MSEIKIRRAKSSDAEFIGKLIVEAWSPIYEGFRSQLGDAVYGAVYPGTPAEAKAAKFMAEAGGGNMLIAEIDGEICGFATYHYDGGIGVLSENAVSPLYKGKGIAGKLYEKVFDELRTLGCKIVRVVTGLDEAHSSARRAYEKAGFSVSLSSINYFKEL